MLFVIGDGSRLGEQLTAETIEHRVLSKIWRIQIKLRAATLPARCTTSRETKRNF